MGQRETSGKHGKPLSKEGDVSGDRRHRVVDFCVGYVIGVNDVCVYDSSGFIALLVGSDAMHTVAMSHERLTGRVHLVKE
jgi:hypothetical protein